jgi:two-component system, chemotaxis family, sensor kinase CheA
MEELRQIFLADSISRLENLKNKITAEPFFAELRSETFRALHTIKGTAHSFGLLTAAHLAHDLENLLAAAHEKKISAAELRTLLPEGIEILIKSLADRHFRFAPEFAEKFQKYVARKDELDLFDENSLGLPEAILTQMSKQEKIHLRRAVEDGSNLEVLEIGFAPENFAEEFKNFRRDLSAKGEIIATLPNARFAAENKIGFQIIFATFENSMNFVGDYPVEHGAPTLYQAVSVATTAIVAEMVEYAEKLAANAGKTVEFETAIDADALAPKQARVIFDALLHLVRNAVDHGVERAGKIEIEILSDSERVYLKVADDGRGVDLKKLRAKAIEKNLLAPDAEMSEAEILNLIFAPEFSTAETVSETSGRGVGLDAVKTAVETAGGSIYVQSETGKGTTFEIVLKQK